MGVGKMTYEEFLAWAGEDTLAEWVDGEVESHGGGWVRSAPFQMKTGPDLPGREPDLLVVRPEHLHRLRRTFLDGPADVAVEIVSPESVGRDRGEKFYEYARGGVPEYWLLDPQLPWAEFYQLEGTHYRMTFSGQEGTYHTLVLPGFWVRVEWLWQEPLPAVEDTLLEIGGEAYARRWIERLRRQGFLPGAGESR